MPEVTPVQGHLSWQRDLAREHGCGVVDGVEMLVQLAMQLFTLWTCIVPEEEVFQKAVAQALGE